MDVMDSGGERTIVEAMRVSAQTHARTTLNPMFEPTDKADTLTAPPTVTPSRVGRVADAAADNWFDRMAPAIARPFGRLARFDRPTGAMLLLFPCWWGQMLAEVQQGHAYPNVRYLLLFLAGAFVMRGAGCAYNDFIDRDYDAQVERTRSRPIPSGQVTPLQALLFACILSLIGLLVLIQFNSFTIQLGIASLALVAAYPFAKRMTNWAQLVLGLTFKWGALVGYAAITGGLGWPALLLYAGCIAWTIGYDTIYAHQDSRDDAVIGLRSTALRFGQDTGLWLAGLYGAAVALWLAASLMASAGWPVWMALAGVGLQMVWQIATLDTANPANCLERFKSNKVVGWLFALGLLCDLVLVQAAGRL
jgi:4-hydroxybenzoate polyprenyltransferase